jgi:putative ATP-binding cassette transporter
MIKETTDKYKNKLIFLGIISGVNAFITMYIIKSLTDVTTLYKENEFLFWSLEVLLFILLSFALSNLSGYLSAKTGIQIRYDLRKNIVERALVTGYSNIKKLKDNRLYTSLTHDIETVSNFINFLPTFVYHSLTVLACISFLCYTSPTLFIIPFIFIALSIVVTSTLMSKGIAHFKAFREDIDTVNNNIKGIVDGIKELNQSYTRKQFFYKNDIIRPLNKLKQSDLSQSVFYMVYQNWIQISVVLCILIMHVANHQFNLSDQQDLLGFILVFMYIQGPINSLISSKEFFSKAKVAIFSIENLSLESSKKIEQDSPPINFQPGSKLEFKNIKFSYDVHASDFKINSASLDIKHGEIIFIRGGNGSGKSTLSKIITGLLKPDQGSILLNSEKIESNCDSYRKLFGCVHPDSYLFKSILDEKGMLSDQDKINDFLKLIKLDHKIVMNDSYIPTVDLSQGQKKRLSLMLSFLENSPILFLDEFAADQDPDFKAYFYEYLLGYFKKIGKTVIVITHDEEYFHLSDRVLYMTNGELMQG